MTAKPMSMDEVIKRLAFVRKIVAGMSEEDVVETAIALLQSQPSICDICIETCKATHQRMSCPFYKQSNPDTKGQRVGEKEIADIIYAEESLADCQTRPCKDCAKGLAHALAARLAVPKMDK